MVIYKIINTINNKIYIGKDEKNKHNYYGSGRLIKDAIKKYGKEKFKKEILYETNNRQLLCEKEREYIKKLNSLIPIGYNIALGGNGGATRTGIKHSKETREKQRIAKLGIKFTDEHKENIRKSRLGKKASEETKKKMSKASSGTNHWFYGKTHTEETKGKISESRKGKFTGKRSKEICLKISKSVSGENNPMWGKKGELHHNYGKAITQEQIDKFKNTINNKTKEEMLNKYILWYSSRYGNPPTKEKILEKKTIYAKKYL